MMKLLKLGAVGLAAGGGALLAQDLKLVKEQTGMVKTAAPYAAGIAAAIVVGWLLL